MKDFEDAMLDIAWKNMESENNRFKDIDAKAIGVITITGILMTFLEKPINPGIPLILLFISTAFFFLVAILYSVFTIRVRAGDSISTKILVNSLKNETSEHKIRGIICTVANAEDKLGDVCDNKARELSISVHALGMGVFVLILYSLFTFVFL